VEAAYKLVCYEDENTGYQTIGPVSKMLNLVCRYAAEGPESEAFERHLARIDDFLWMGEEGMMMTGTNGSQLWDIAFLSQAVVETGIAASDAPGNAEACVRALEWLDKAQMTEDPMWYGEAYRHRTKGAWPFSTPEQGYTVCSRPRVVEGLG
jgi:lanosterol synthase